MHAQTIGSEIKRTELTRRNVFYHGLIGKVKCLYYWLKFCDEKRSVSFHEWLDESLGYSIEPLSRTNKNDCLYHKDVENELRHYLIDEVPIK